jgi:hypothetical protein
MRVIETYYGAIRDRNYALAYHQWSDGGRSSGKTLDAFAAGFANTEDVQAVPGPPGRVEGAAGSRYLEVPVIVIAHTRSGATQRFRGSYTLRRTVVDGATEEQRQWHLYSASLVAVH